MTRTNRISRFATIAILPMMAIVLVFASRAVQPAQRGVESPREGLLVVANLRAESLSLLDLPNGVTGTLALPGPPHEMVFTGGRLYVSLGRGNALVEVDPYAPGILRVLQLDGEPHGLAADDERLYVTLDRGGMLVTVDRASLAEVARTPVGSTPHAVAVLGRDAYVTDSGDNRLRAIPGDILATTGELPESVAGAGRFIATADNRSGTVSVFTRDGLRFQRRVAVGAGPVRVLALPGDRLVVSLSGGARIAIIDPGAGEIERRLATGGHPDGMCASPTGGYLAVASNEANRVDLFRIRDWANAGSIDAGDGPGACAWLSSR